VIFERITNNNAEKGNVPRIMACVDTDFDAFREKLGPFKWKQFLHGAKNVDYYMTKMSATLRGFAYWEDAFVISGVDESPKYTTQLYNCTAIIGSGVHKRTGKAISFLSHQNPKQFMYSPSAQSFEKSLTATINTLFDDAQDGSVDIVIAGGHVLSGADQYSPLSRAEYQNTIMRFQEILAPIVQERTGVENYDPTVICGPNHVHVPYHANVDDCVYQQNLFVDTQNHRVFVFKPEQPLCDHTNIAFSASQCEAMLQQCMTDECRLYWSEKAQELQKNPL